MTSKHLTSTSPYVTLCYMGRWLLIIGISATAGAYLEKRHTEKNCRSYVQWTSDVQMRTTQFCPPTHTVSVQTAMDGYNVVCQCG